MADDFKDPVFREMDYDNKLSSGNVIKKDNFEITGRAKISIEEESHEGVKFILKKDEFDNIKEIKFVCSCGQTKSIILDYSD